MSEPYVDSVFLKLHFRFSVGVSTIDFHVGCIVSVHTLTAIRRIYAFFPQFFERMKKNYLKYHK